MVSLELVPRSREALEKGLCTARNFPGIDFINVPDLTRFSIRSWEACGMLAAFSGGPGPGFIPHLRARDFDPAAPFPLAGYFRDQGIRRVLVIAGDPPGGEAAAPVNVREGTVPFIKKLKRELPGLDILAAFDPYRTNIRYELDYLMAKEEAGASGFMSQPFFDLRLLEIYAEYLEGKRVFWGVTPVLSGASRNYWESRNRAVFPKQFRAALDWNIAFGRRVMDFCRAHDFNLYLMPIKVDLEGYLSGLWESPMGR
jgi:methylenetetrahydrofolate reductase (NADPH)